MCVYYQHWYPMHGPECIYITWIGDLCFFFNVPIVSWPGWWKKPTACHQASLRIPGWCRLMFDNLGPGSFRGLTMRVSFLCVVARDP